MRRSLSPARTIRDTRSAGITAPVDDEWKQWQHNPTAHGPARLRAPPSFVRAAGEYDDRGQQIKQVEVIEQDASPINIPISEWYSSMHHARAPHTASTNVSCSTDAPPMSDTVIDLTGDTPPSSPKPISQTKRDWFAIPKSTHRPATVSLAHMPTIANKGPHYTLGEDNQGHRMLRNMGWEGQGLGKSTNRTAPIGTILKLDRGGLGRGKSAAKVTHTERDLQRAKRQRGKASH